MIIALDKYVLSRSMEESVNLDHTASERSSDLILFCFQNMTYPVLACISIEEPFMTANEKKNCYLDKIDLIIWAASRQNLSSRFPIERDSNQSPRLQRLARILKICL